MDVDILHTACFWGQLPETFPFHEDNIEYLRLQSQIEQAIQTALALGYTAFLCGMEKGFSLLCADILLDIREQQKKHHNIRLVAVLPYPTHTHAHGWGALHDTVKQCADQIVITSPYHHTSNQTHKQYLLRNSSYLIFCDPRGSLVL